MTPTWMDAERKLALAGIVALFSSRLIGIVLLLGGLLNLRDNAFAHHGEHITLCRLLYAIWR